MSFFQLIVNIWFAFTFPLFVLWIIYEFRRAPTADPHEADPYEDQS